VTLGERVRFERVWGAPVASHTSHREPFELHSGKETVVDADKIGNHHSLVLYGPVRVAAGTTIPAHLKVHGPVSIEPGVHIGGNLISRGNVTLAEEVTIGGHIFAEGDIRLGPRSRVSRESVAKTVYATGAVLIANDVEVFGWVVSENGGHTL
jgi:predicted acyltransferase (DUF342 family)